MRFFFRSSCIVAVDLALVAAALQAQPAASRPVERFEDRASVVEVQVPVSVVDRSGAPVHGLQLQDFELYDQGRLQQISDVAVYDLAVATGETGRLENSPALPSAARRHFLLLFDLSFSRPAQIVRARQAARELVLTRLHPQDLVAVMVYSLEHGPRMIITFTPDRAQLARAIDTLGMDRDPSHSATLDPLRFMLAEDSITSTSTTSSSADQGRASELRAAMEQVQLEYMNQLAIAAEKDQKAFERSRITAFTRALGEMARQLDAVRGRKQVLLFSEGFDSRLLLGRGVEDESEREKEQADLNFGRSWQVDSDNRFGNTGLQNDVTRMIEEFRRADCVIQAVDIGGLRAGGEMNRPGRSLGQDALFVMANETGGRLFKEANDLGRELDRVLLSTRLTYVLTFVPSALKPDGSYHRVRVELKNGRGLQLSHRAGYYAPRPFKDLDPLEKSLLASDAIASATPRDDLRVNVLAAPFRGGAADAAYVPVIIEIAGADLLAGHASNQVRLEIYGYVTDRSGEMRDFFNQTVGLDIGRSRAALERTGVKYYGHFVLASGDHLLRILVRDADNGRSGVATLPLTIPPYAKQEPHLLPPFFLETPGKWLLVRESGGNRESTVVYPFTVNGDPFVPAARPQLANAESARLVLVAYNLGVGELDLEAQVMDAGGHLTPAGLSGIERTTTGIAGLDKVLASFAPTGLVAGDYTLQVALRNRASGAQETSSIPFVVIN